MLNHNNLGGEMNADLIAMSKRQNRKESNVVVCHRVLFFFIRKVKECVYELTGIIYGYIFITFLWYHAF